jgi:hypothetical protein
MPTCSLTGSATGVAAALAVKNNVPIREFATKQIRFHLMADDPEAELMRIRMEQK